MTDSTWEELVLKSPVPVLVSSHAEAPGWRGVDVDRPRQMLILPAARLWVFRRVRFCCAGSK